MARKARDNDQEFEDLSSYSSSSGYRKGGKGRSGFTPLRVALMVLCALLIILGATLIYISTGLMTGQAIGGVKKESVSASGATREESEPQWEEYGSTESGAGTIGGAE